MTAFVTALQGRNRVGLLVAGALLLLPVLAGCDNGGDPIEPEKPAPDLAMAKVTVETYSKTGTLDMGLDEVSNTVESYPDSPEKAEAVTAVEALGAAGGNKRKVKKAAAELLEKMNALPATTPAT